MAPRTYKSPKPKKVKQKKNYYFLGALTKKLQAFADLSLEELNEQFESRFSEEVKNEPWFYDSSADEDGIHRRHFAYKLLAKDRAEKKKQKREEEEEAAKARAQEEHERRLDTEGVEYTGPIIELGTPMEMEIDDDQEDNESAADDADDEAEELEVDNFINRRSPFFGYLPSPFREMYEADNNDILTQQVDLNQGILYTGAIPAPVPKTPKRKAASPPADGDKVLDGRVRPRRAAAAKAREAMSGMR